MQTNPGFSRQRAQPRDLARRLQLRQDQHPKNLYLNTEDGINHIAIRSTMTAGTIKVTANRDGLKSATVTFTSSPVTIPGGLSQEAQITSHPPQPSRAPGNS